MKECKCFVKNLIWNKNAFVIALVHFVISFWTDQIIFKYTWMDFSTGLHALKSLETIAVKFVFLILLIVIWQGLFYYMTRAGKRFRNLSLFYFCLMTVLLILTWPGIWRMDEFGLLSSSIQLYPHWWQNYITSVWYIFSMMLFPFPAGVIITMIVTVSLLYARVICNAMYILEVEYGFVGGRMKEKNAGFFARMKPDWIIILLTIPFVMFPVLDSNLYPLRMSLYAFLELTLLSEIYLLYKTSKWKRENNRTTGGYKQNITLLIILAAIVTVWRTEAIYYLAAFPVLLLIIGGFKQFWKQIILYIILFVILFVPQKAGEKITSGEQYELTSVVLPLVPLVLEAKEDNCQDLLEKIDTVVDIDVIERAAKEGKNGISMFWSEPDFQRVYTEQDFASFKSAYYQLIMKYPTVFLKERWETFLASTDLLENTTELFVKNDVINYETFQSYPLSMPLSDDLRTVVIKTLEIRTQKNYQEKTWITNLIYSAVPSILILIIAGVVLLCRKRWVPLVILLTALMKVPLVFLTAPSKLFMYYYSVYLIGYVVLFFGIVFFVYEKQSRGKL